MDRKIALRQKLRKLDFQSLEVFYNLYIYRSVTEVSEILSLSQSTVSYSLNRLRTAFDDDLFVNLRSGMQPTNKSIVLIESIEDILRKISACGIEKKEFSPQNTETVFTIFSPEYFEMLIIPILFKKILQEELKIRFEVIRPENKVPFSMIYEQKIDFGIVVKQSHYPHNLCHQSILSDQLVAVFDGPSRTHQPLSIEELSKLKQIFPSPWLTNNCMVDNWLKKHDTQRSISIKANGYYSALRMLTSSEMMVMLPKKIYKKVVSQHMSLHTREVHQKLPGFELDMIWSPLSSNNPANIWLRKQIIKACQEVNAS
ncbi:LysR family transcriptional regulator [Xenorhabdus cabanillasii]|uniref:LysR family transcriptional regulator n=1 Tax=Xenorhabdus cabanillasii TaxID=351673 RepID=A0A3D9UPM3_9GAMM|nr:LysR family transcriptional regulator [Xenorhabdus cabanillasii]REF28605.1 LysR family transcriptional regulator [Xenorhabdus cabanillasii]